MCAALLPRKTKNDDKWPQCKWGRGVRDAKLNSLSETSAVPTVFTSTETAGCWKCQAALLIELSARKANRSSAYDFISLWCSVVFWWELEGQRQRKQQPQHLHASVRACTGANEPPFLTLTEAIFLITVCCDSICGTRARRGEAGHWAIRAWIELLKETSNRTNDNMQKCQSHSG